MAGGYGAPLDLGQITNQGESVVQAGLVVAAAEFSQEAVEDFVGMALAQLRGITVTPVEEPSENLAGLVVVEADDCWCEVVVFRTLPAEMEVLGFVKEDLGVGGTGAEAGYLGGDEGLGAVGDLEGIEDTLENLEPGDLEYRVLDAQILEHLGRDGN